MPRFAPLILLYCAGMASAQTGPGQRIRGEADASQTRSRLIEAQQKIASGKALDAANDLQRIIDESGDDLVLFKADQFVPARRLAQQYLVGLPAEILSTLQDRQEEAAKKLLEAGKRKPELLEKLVSRYFISRSTEPALLLLGELAFERGDYALASLHWSRLLPAPEAGIELVYPAPKIDLALVRAKRIMAWIFAGELERASRELIAFRKLHPASQGRLAGKEGILAERLADLLQNPPARLSEDSAWTSFAGGPSRNQVGTLAGVIPSSPTWKTSIPRDGADQDVQRPAGVPAARTLAFHPVILGDKAYIADASRIFSFDLQTGAARIAFDFRSLPQAPDFSTSELALPETSGAAFTLTVAGGRIYARLGNKNLGTTEAMRPSPVSALVALEPIAAKEVPEGALTLRMSWVLTPPTRAEKADQSWEGAPLVVDGRVYAAFQRVVAGKASTAVACYENPPGPAPLWVADLTDPDGQAALPRNRHGLLTLCGTNVVYSTHQGLTLAIDRISGKLAWAFRNPPATRPPVIPARDLCPPIAANGKIFIAPADGDQIYALDADDGRPVWQAGPLQAEQLLGVVGNRLIATIAGPSKGIRGFDIITGSDRAPAGWRNHEDPLLGSYGRGLLADGRVLWPTKEKLYVLNAATGSVATMPLSGAHGNLALGPGVLLVATPREVWGYRLTPKPEENRRSQLERFLHERDRLTLEERSRELNLFLQQQLESSTSPEVRAAAALALFQAQSQPGEAFVEQSRIDRKLLDQFVAGPNGMPKTLGIWLGVLRPQEVPEKPEQIEAPEAIAAPALANPATARQIWDTSSTYWPLRPTANHRQASSALILHTDGQSLLAQRPGDPRPLWQRPVDQLLSWRSDTAGIILASGPRGILAVATGTGDILWRFGLPSNYPSLGVPQANRRHVVVPLGSHAILCFTLSTGQIAWFRYTTARLGPYAIDSSAAYSPGFTLTDTHALLQRSDELLEIVELRSGAVTQRTGPNLLWDIPPLELGNDRVVVPEGPTTIRAIRLGTGREIWSFDARGEASATGALPRMHLLGNVLLVAISRNYGTEIYRLHPESGTMEWPNPRVFNVDRLRLDLADASGELLYVVATGKLYALRARDGRIEWRSTIPDYPATIDWQVRVGRSHLLLWPERPIAEEADSEVVERIARRLGESVSGTRALSLIAMNTVCLMERKLPVLLLEPERGEFREKHELATGPLAQAIFHGREAIVVGCRAIWRLEAR